MPESFFLERISFVACQCPATYHPESGIATYRWTECGEGGWRRLKWNANTCTNRLLSLKSKIKYKYLRRHIVRISPRHRIMYLEESNNTATPSGLKARRWAIYISKRFSERGWTKCYIVWPRPRGTNVMKNWQTSPSKVYIKIQDKIRIRTHNRAWHWFIFIDIARWHGSPEESSLIFFFLSFLSCRCCRYVHRERFNSVFSSYYVMPEPGQPENV